MMRRLRGSFYYRRKVVETQAVIRALSSPTRAHILGLVVDRARSLSELAAALDVGVSCVYAAVQILEQAQLVVTQRRGRKRLVRSRFRKIDIQFA